MGTVNRRTNAPQFVIGDVYDGRMYKQFGYGKLFMEYAISLIMSTDGVPASKSSKRSIWPVHCFVLEFPPLLRKLHPILSCFRCGYGKPDMNALLRGFVNEIKKLSLNGFKWALDGRIITSTVDLVAIVCDTVARAPVQNFIQFHGYFGCSWCEHPTIRVEGINNNLYNFREFCAQRNKYSVRNCAIRALESNFAFRGVLGHSVLSELPLVDIVDGLVFDSMHGIDLGVMRQLASLWFGSENSHSPFYIGTLIQQLDLK